MMTCSSFLHEARIGFLPTRKVGERKQGGGADRSRQRGDPCRIENGGRRCCRGRSTACPIYRRLRREMFLLLPLATPPRPLRCASGSSPRPSRCVCGSPPRPLHCACGVIDGGRKAALRNAAVATPLLAAVVAPLGVRLTTAVLRPILPDTATAAPPYVWSTAAVVRGCFSLPLTSVFLTEAERRGMRRGGSGVGCGGASLHLSLTSLTSVLLLETARRVARRGGSASALKWR